MYRLHITENNDTTLSKVKPLKECFQCSFTVIRRNINHWCKQNSILL